MEDMMVTAGVDGIVSYNGLLVMELVGVLCHCVSCDGGLCVCCGRFFL